MSVPINNLRQEEVLNIFFMLPDCDVTWQMSPLPIIQNVLGNLAPIISRIQCPELWISGMRLSTNDQGHSCPHPADADLCGLRRWGWVMALWSSTWTLSSPTMAGDTVGRCSVRARIGWGIGTSWPLGGRAWDGAWRRIEPMFGLRETEFVSDQHSISTGLFMLRW